MADARNFSTVALTRLLHLEGNTDGSEDGAFRGVALAIGWWDSPTDADSPMYYLVSDMSKPAPIWVAAPMIERQYHGGAGAGV